MAWFPRYGLAEKCLFGLPWAPGGLLVMGGQKAHFGAEKWAWRPLEAIPSGGAVERKLRAMLPDPWSHFLGHTGRRAGCRGVLLVEKLLY